MRRPDTSEAIGNQPYVVPHALMIPYNPIPSHHHHQPTLALPLSSQLRIPGPLRVDLVQPWPENRVISYSSNPAFSHHAIRYALQPLTSQVRATAPFVSSHQKAFIDEKVSEKSQLPDLEPMPMPTEKFEQKISSRTLTKTLFITNNLCCIFSIITFSQ